MPATSVMLIFAFAFAFAGAFVDVLLARPPVAATAPAIRITSITMRRRDILSLLVRAVDKIVNEFARVRVRFAHYTSSLARALIYSRAGDALDRGRRRG